MQQEQFFAISQDKNWNIHYQKRDDIIKTYEDIISSCIDFLLVDMLQIRSLQQSYSTKSHVFVAATPPCHKLFGLQTILYYTMNYEKNTNYLFVLLQLIIKYTVV